MEEIYVNLKRFEVPRDKGGLCPTENPTEWISSVMKKSVQLGLGCIDNLLLVYLLPEGLIPAAINELQKYPSTDTQMIAVGCQGVHWEDIQPGKNFGAFTSSLPATAAKNLGSSWAIIGHSEERKAKLQVIETFETSIISNEKQRARATRAVDQMVRSEVGHALETGLNVLLCVGESAQEKGSGNFDDQQPRIESILKTQLLTDLEYMNEINGECKVVIGYEPIWAIGPGKTPPGEAYISFVSGFIKNVVKENFGLEVSVVYGGGLKEENATMISGIETIDGGLVALTRFTGEIGFDVDELKGIIDKYLE
jgi:triosephosphate isomerase